MRWPKVSAWPRVKLGWVLLVVLFVYSLVVTGAWLRAQSRVAEAAAAPPEAVEEAAPQADGLWFPVVGARLPQNPSYLPGAARPYRQGVNQGFNFYSDDAGVPIAYGTPVIAAADATVQRADLVYREHSQEEWQALLDAVEEGADEAQLDRLRGRQIVLETDDGYLLRYAHLANIRPGITTGVRVYRGQVIGFVGNSGTTEGVRGSTQGSRLHFEVWEPEGSFFGEDLDEETLRLRAASLFVGP